ncbi:unnamed protein product [Rhizophagus irregularis]|nr:unnamed protein product [Rhizophagus irregularis]
MLQFAKPKNTQQNTRLWFSRFEEFVKNTQPDIDLLTLYDKKEIFKTKELFNLHEDYEFRAVRDTLHARMIELEEINNGDYNGADPLTNEEMIQIFNHSDMSNNMPDGLLRRILKEIENGNWYTTSHMGQDKLTGMLKEICNITGIDYTNRRIVNHSLRKYTSQKLNDERLDSQAIMNVFLRMCQKILIQQKI